MANDGLEQLSSGVHEQSRLYATSGFRHPSVRRLTLFHWNLGRHTHKSKHRSRSELGRFRRATEDAVESGNAVDEGAGLSHCGLLAHERPIRTRKRRIRAANGVGLDSVPQVLPRQPRYDDEHEDDLSTSGFGVN